MLLRSLNSWDYKNRKYWIKFTGGKLREGNTRNNKFKLLYLLNSDNLKFEKNDEFIIYQGSHGDRGAEIADVILPSAAYTEENGLYQNLEGRVQECRKASYPVGEALESWKVLNKLTNAYKNKNLFDSFNTLRNEALEKIVNFESLNKLPKYKEPSKKVNNNFEKESIYINPIDYYFSNSISRASKVMSECRDIKLKYKPIWLSGSLRNSIKKRKIE